MSDPFFDHPILNSPYEYPSRHWELDEGGQPTQKIIERSTAQPVRVAYMNDRDQPVSQNSCAELPPLWSMS
jgi:type III restriction enzyme